MSLYLDIHKKFSAFSLDVSLNAGDETLAVLGASGSGKSLTLACIAGIVRPDRGKIILNGRTVFDSANNINVPVKKRHTGLMFQDYALFPNMTVEENIRISSSNDTHIADEIIYKFGLESVRNLYPSQISGGQKQRASLARTLLSRPEILMLDEPFSAMDSHLRFHMERELLNVIRDFAGTVILVSHNRDEAFRLSDSLAVFHNGHVDICGSKYEVFNHPGTRNAAVLTGCKNISRLERISQGKIFASDWGIALECHDVPDDAEYTGIRMHSITHESGINNCFDCKVTQVTENPFSFTVMLIPKSAGECTNPIGWEVSKTLWQEIKSESITVRFPPENILMLRE